MHRQDLEESEKVFECNLPLWLASSLVSFRLAWYIFALSHTFNRQIILLHSSVIEVFGIEVNSIPNCNQCIQQAVVRYYENRTECCTGEDSTLQLRYG